MVEENKLNIEDYVNVMRTKIILKLDDTGDFIKQTINELYSMLDTQLKLNESLRKQLEESKKESEKMGKEPDKQANIK